MFNIRNYTYRNIRTPSESLRVGLILHKASALENHFVIEDYALVYIFSGHATFALESGEPTVLRAGSFFQRFPGVPHKTYFSKNCERGYFAMPSSAFQMLSKLYPHFAKGPTHFVGKEEKFKERWEELLSLALTRGDSSPLSLVSSMFDLLQEFALVIDSEETKGDMIGGVSLTKRLDRKNKKDDLLEKGAELLSSGNFDDEISPEIVADALKINYHTFRRRFKAYFGKGPAEFRKEKIVNKAAALLIDGSNSISSVSDHLGFPDRYTFSARFKEVMGVSPRKFREIESGKV